jgi:hypothetical protein
LALSASNEDGLKEKVILVWDIRVQKNKRAIRKMKTKYISQCKAIEGKFA